MYATFWKVVSFKYNFESENILITLDILSGPSH
jgi:hypothetical protein